MKQESGNDVWSTVEGILREVRQWISLIFEHQNWNKAVDWIQMEGFYLLQGIMVDMISKSV